MPGILEFCATFYIVLGWPREKLKQTHPSNLGFESGRVKLAADLRQSDQRMSQSVDFRWRC